MFLKHAHFLHNVIEENIELIGYDNNDKTFHWVYLFTMQARVGFLQKFWIEHQTFSNQLKKSLFWF